MKSETIKQAPLRGRPLKLVADKFHISRRRLHDNISGWLFIAPVLLWVLVFTAYALYASLRLSFREWNPLGMDEFVGLANYRELFTKDWVFWLAYKNALYYALLTISAGLVWGIAVALALQNI